MRGKTHSGGGLESQPSGTIAPFSLTLTVSVPHDLRLVVFHSGVNDHSAAQAHGLSFGAKGDFEFVGDGC